MNDAISALDISVSPEALDTPAFLLSDVAAATAVNSNLLKAWLDRKVVPLGATDRHALGRGSGRVFTLRRVLSIAIMAELTRLGVAPSSAAALAFSVTDHSINVADVEFSLRSVSEGGYVIVSSKNEDEALQFMFIPAGGNIPLESVMGARRSVAIVSFAALFSQVFDALVRRGKWPLK